MSPLILNAARPESRAQKWLALGVFLLAVVLALFLTFCAVALGFHPERP